MVKHIVFFKLSDNCEENKRLVKEKLLTLDSKVNTLKNIEVGVNFCDEDRAYDIALITVIDSKEDLNSYAIDPYHLEIVSFIKTVASSSKVVDFEY